MNQSTLQLLIIPRWITMLILGMFMSAVQSAPTTVADVQEVQRFLEGAMGEHVSIEKTFPAPMNLTGVIVNTQSAERIILYVDSHLEHFLVGMIFDGKGQNLTAQYIEKNMPDAALDSAFGRLEKLPYIEEGHPNAPVVYVIADPNCPYCKKLHEQADRDLQDGKLRIRWILTSSLGHDGKAEFIYSAEKRIPGSGAEVLRQYYKGFGEKDPEYDEYGAESVAFANRFFNDMGIKGTPFLMYRSRSGSVGMHVGVPEVKTYKQILSTLP